jgi:pimeloyl-ACP methyl ester carboxylesterase/GNAT superfamily N-acetyltransferase
MMPEFIYLHGFASSPGTLKALFFKTRLSSWDILLRIPDLNVPSFSSLTLTSMIERLAQEVQECSPAPVYIIASSLGAMVALHFVDRFKQDQASGVKKMLFLAPSFDFAESRLRQIGNDGLAQWKATGRFRFHHHLYKKEYKVSYGLIDDLMKYDSYHMHLSIPILIFHGYHDKNVSYEQSVKFAERSKDVTLRLVNSDHTLLDQLDDIWSTSVQFFDLCTICKTMSPIIIQAYNLANAAELVQFKPYEGEFLGVLEAAYRGDFYEREVQLNRIYGKDHTFGAHYVFLAFFKTVGKSNLVGCSYIRPDGKRSATAVLPEYQGLGIGRQMICESLKVFDNQFTEISPSDLRMQHLLLNIGFRLVVSESDMKHYLGKVAHLLRSIRYQDNKLLYKRSLSLHHGVEREFVMFKYHR